MCFKNYVHSLYWLLVWEDLILHNTEEIRIGEKIETIYFNRSKEDKS